MVTKGDLIKGALQHLAVDGLLIQPMAQDEQAAIQHADDFAAANAQIGLDSGYLQPAEYGTSTGGDDSGVDIALVGPLKILIAAYIATMYGRMLDPVKVSWAQSMLTSQLVSVNNSRYPVTLPTGSGNYDLDVSTFYNGNLP